MMRLWVMGSGGLGLVQVSSGGCLVGTCGDFMDDWNGGRAHGLGQQGRAHCSSQLVGETDSAGTSQVVEANKGTMSRRLHFVILLGFYFSVSYSIK